MLTLSSGTTNWTNQAMTTANGSFELYDGPGRANYRAPSLEDEHLSPPGGPSYHPPGSPKLMKDVDRMRRSQEESSMLKQLKIANPSGTFGEKAFKENSMEDDMKDSRIRHLQRQVTILQADLHKKDGLEKRMIELTKEKNLADDRLRTLLARDEALTVQHEAVKKEMASKIDHLQHRNVELEGVIKQVREENNRLLNERHIYKSRSSKESCDSASPPSSTSVPTNGISRPQSMALSSDLSYHNELDSLHKMVDMLRSTVLEQRNVFLKLGVANGPFTGMSLSQQTASTTVQQETNSASLRPAALDDCNNTVITNGTAIPSASATSSATSQSSSAVMTAQPVRQAEESCEMVSSSSNNAALKIHSSAARGSSKERNPPGPILPQYPDKESHDGIPNHLTNSTTGGVEYNLHKTQSHVLAPSSGSPRRNRPSSVSSELIPGMERLNVSAMSGNAVPPSSAAPRGEVIYVNNNGAFDNTFYKHDMALAGQSGDRIVISGQRVSPPGRRSQSAIIDRRPNLIEGTPLPMKSHTQTFGKSPIVPSPPLPPHQLHHKQQQARPQPMGGPSSERLGHIQRPPDTIGPTYPPGFPVSPSPSVTGATTAPTVIPAQRFGIRGPIMAGGVPVSSQPLVQTGAWQNGHQRAAPTATRPPFEAEGCIISPVPVSNTLSNISDVRSSSTSSPPQPLGRQQDRNGNSNRLCPVCNQDFGHISMEDFQTHVFDCFDNDNGPETLQATEMEHPPRMATMMGTQHGRTCPMCQQKFDLSTPQSEFEQHVHRHFGEEAFEEL